MSYVRVCVLPRLCTRTPFKCDMYAKSKATIPRSMRMSPFFPTCPRRRGRSWQFRWVHLPPQSAGAIGSIGRRGRLITARAHHPLGALIWVAAEGGGSEGGRRRGKPIGTPSRGDRDQAHSPCAQKERFWSCAKSPRRSYAVGAHENVCRRACSRRASSAWHARAVRASQPTNPARSVFSFSLAFSTAHATSRRLWKSHDAQQRPPPREYFEYFEYFELEN